MGEEAQRKRSPRGEDEEEERPPLPPRPGPVTNPSVDSRLATPTATTAITPVDIQTLSFPDGSRGTFSWPGNRAAAPPGFNGSGSATPKQQESQETEDSMSVTSFAPTMRPAGDIASLMIGDFNKKSPAWNLLRSQSATVLPFQVSGAGKDSQSRTLGDFEKEFDPLGEVSSNGSEDERRLALWKAKLKHYMILSSAGKPIWSRHGDPALINSYIGVVQTIISFYQGARNPLLGFSAGSTRFVIVTEGPLYLVAISKLGESDGQLRAQLEALYMQILSTLTLPTLRNIFAHRPSTDLQKPLQGTESLLSSLADKFTKGSASALLGSLECLKLRKSQRSTINNTFLKKRTGKLLYGLIVAGGKLVSVIRPRRHSLHPSDLQLIFNMLFESDAIRSGGGESWIPLCLPAFNNSGYLYMYVSFLDDQADHETPEEATTAYSQPDTADEDIAIILISADKESFFELQQMRNDVAASLTKNGSFALIKSEARAGRPRPSDIAPGSQISHFLYKSRPNVQFTMSALDPVFTSPLARRLLMTTYGHLHSAVHTKHAHMKVLHSANEEATSLCWVTASFEFYCVAGPNTNRAVMTQGANKIIQWAKREEERIFIIGGGVF